MGTILTIANADFSANAFAFAAPVASGLQGWFFLGGGSAAAIQKDYAYLANLGIGGGPTFGAGFTTFGGFATGQWLSTGISETADQTIFVVARSSDTLASGHDPVLVSDYGADGSNGISTAAKGITLQVIAPDAGGAPGANIIGYHFVNNAGVTTLAAAGSLDFPAFNSFKALSHVINSAAGTDVVNNLTGGTSVTSSFTLPRFPNVTNKFRIGAAYTNNGGGSCDIAFVAIYNRALSSVEQQTVYAFIKKYLLAKYSIAV